MERITLLNFTDIFFLAFLILILLLRSLKLGSTETLCICCIFSSSSLETCTIFLMYFLLLFSYESLYFQILYWCVFLSLFNLLVRCCVVTTFLFGKLYPLVIGLYKETFHWPFLLLFFVFSVLLDLFIKSHELVLIFLYHIFYLISFLLSTRNVFNFIFYISIRNCYHIFNF